jgi:CRISPR-associated protein (TIGR03986 family)
VSVIREMGPAWAARSGETLTAEMSYRPDGKKAAIRIWQRSELDPALAAWFADAADGDQVEVQVDVDLEKGQAVLVRMANPPVLIAPKPCLERLDAMQRYGGGVNPYTFIPALPRDGLPEEFADAAPAPHGVINPDGHWSGWLTLRLVTRTPLLLPHPETATRDAEDHPTYPVRLGPDGQPLLHGASVKGALRSAYEAVTGSRFGVFRGHDRALAYRQPATTPKVTPARVEPDGQGGLRFRLCAWPPLSVPLYQTPSGRPRSGQHTRRLARAVGSAQPMITIEEGTQDWGKLHGCEVWYTTRNAGQPGRTRTVIDEITLATEPRPDDAAGKGWLSITGRSIENKASERLFVASGTATIPVEDHHHELWHAVLASYRDAAEYNEPSTDKAGRQLERSRHVPLGDDVPAHLAEGDLVYLSIAAETPGRGARPGQRPTLGPADITAVHPVIFGRHPYSRPPGQALDKSLHPAAELGGLSPADRLFGWVPGRNSTGRRASSGYRGRLRVEAVTCQTADWLTDHSPAGGVTLAPLSSPKPTQFRFYVASDATGTPVDRAAAKPDGYRAGLRGRKAYWYPSPAPDGYWNPSGPALPGGRFREWQAVEDAKASQTSTHLGWARQGTEFTVRLFLDAVPGPELGPLIWLASQEGCALRLGAGKPHGFGAVTVTVDWEATELRTGEGLRGCWLTLDRPAPAPRADIETLAARFAEAATSNPVLAPAVEAWRQVAQGTEKPIHYPRTQKRPEAETYRWFVANERIEDRKPKYGLALPHVLEDDQRLPLLPPDPGNA